MAERSPRIRWGVEQRLAFIEHRLFWDGWINRADLMNFFGISAPQASADLARYAEAVPGNLTYDSTAKTYVPTASFKPRLGVASSHAYLSQLLLAGENSTSRDELWPAITPAFDVVSAAPRQVPAENLRRVLAAIRMRHSIHVEYQSLTRPKSTRRWIAPHAIAFDGFRWHARAWCDENGEFRDFVLARIVSVGTTQPAVVRAEADAAWHRRVTLRLAPNQDLPDSHRRVIEYDYGMTEGQLLVETRISLAFYFQALHVLDIERGKLAPKRQQVVLLNQEELEEARANARRATQEMLTAQGVQVRFKSPDDVIGHDAN